MINAKQATLYFNKLAMEIQFQTMEIQFFINALSTTDKVHTLKFGDF